MNNKNKYKILESVILFSFFLKQKDHIIKIKDFQKSFIYEKKSNEYNSNESILKHTMNHSLYITDISEFYKKYRYIKEVIIDNEELFLLKNNSIKLVKYFLNDKNKKINFENLKKLRTLYIYGEHPSFSFGHNFQFKNNKLKTLFLYYIKINHNILNEVFFNSTIDTVVFYKCDHDLNMKDVFNNRKTNIKKVKIISLHKSKMHEIFNFLDKNIFMYFENKSNLKMESEINKLIMNK